MIFLNSNQIQNSKYIAADNQWLIKRDGSKIFDTWLGSGTLIFGHNADLVRGSTLDLLPEGAEITEDICAHLQQCIDFPLVALGFQTSGSAAVTRAIRLARAYKNRLKIAVISSFWHGSEDLTLFGKNNK